ncbi:type 2 periplasmic-binding domain-containing protein [Marinomonas shanghaiensis]|uniref:hypothetical protein n=1 Tax=Marinomonas shanghaiensis TaxID=2202418 RepID=UPI001E616A7F|nr:hypothetical protein [Marinomonas shanghaiensis]
MWDYERIQRLDYFKQSRRITSASIGSTPLVADDLQTQRLIAPLGMQPTGYNYALLTLDDPNQDPRIAAFSNWLMGQVTL